MKLLAAVLILSASLLAQRRQIEWSAGEQPIVDQIRSLRKVPDEQRGEVTRALAISIRQLPDKSHRLILASNLANLATEGDFGAATLQEVADTLSAALRDQPASQTGAEPAGPYMTLAQLARYEHVKVTLDAPQFKAAMARLEEIDRKREHGDFTLTDLKGNKWTLSALRGKVVLVNFWATWCPPCRKEMPDLQSLSDRFQSRGLVILAISDEDASKVGPFIEERKFTYPILLDPNRKANEAFAVEGIPKSFVYDRDGKLAAQAIDMRTQRQFLAMLAQAGLQ